VASGSDPFAVESQDDPAQLLLAPPPSSAPAAFATELMTSPAVCTTTGTSVVGAARLMRHHEVKRLPVIDADGQLVGVVSRRDLLKVFLRDAQAIRSEIIEDVLGQVEGVRPSSVGVEVEQGRVVISGSIGSARLAALVLSQCRSVDRVVSATDRTQRDTGMRLAPA
jgi:CBS-domain-containing membrane protein